MNKPNNKWLLPTLISLVIIIVALLFIWLWTKNNNKSQPTPTPSLNPSSSPITEINQEITTQKGNKIIITVPKANSIISNPLEIKGQIPGNWTFEGVFPVSLVDDKNNVITKTSVQVQGEWMTDQLVPFSALIEYNNASTTRGKIIFEKDNPSGEEKNNDQASLPVIFN